MLEPLDVEVDDAVELAVDEKEDWEEFGFASPEAYADYNVRYFEGLRRSSEKHYLPIKERWRRVYERVELEDILTQNAYVDPMYAQLPRMVPVVEELVASLVESAPRPFIEPEGDDNMDDTIVTLNSIVNKVLDANYYERLMVEQATDGVLTNLGVIKMTIDIAADAPYVELEKGNIVLDKIDPRYVWPDPYCKRLSSNPQDWRFLIVGEPRDCTEIDLLFPEHKGIVEPESIYSDNFADKQDRTGPAIKMNKGTDEAIGRPSRGRAMLWEVWINDLRTKEVPLLDDDTGQQLYDIDGEPRVKWVRRYPNGRVMYIANKIVLRDIPNPFKHGHVPYIFFPVRIAKKALTWGIGEALLLIENKINKLDKDAFAALLYNMSSPWIADITAFVERDDLDSLSNAPDQVIVKNQGAEIMRAPPGELPQTFMPIRQNQEDIFDTNAGTGGVQRGDIAKGSQLSADAIQQLQGSGSGRLRLRARITEWGIEELGFQLSHLIPQLYPNKVTITMPDGSKKNYDPDFNHDKYKLSIEAGSSLPGAKQGTQEMAFRLFELDVIDRSELLQVLKWPHKKPLLDRMKQWDILKIILEDKFKKNKTGSAGRKTRYGGG